MPLKVSAKIGSSSYSFLIDTGSSVSIIPYDPSLTPHLRPTAVSLSSASGSNITCHGEVDVELGIRRIRRSFPWSFVVADVVNPILGIDFLSSNSLIVDCNNRVIIDTLTNCKIPVETSNVPLSPFTYSVNNIDPRAGVLLSKYPILTSPLQLSKPTKSTNSSVLHHIDTGNTPPIYFRPRPLTGEKLKSAQSEFQFLLNAGIIQRSKSPWASPLHLVPKKGPDKWRPCGDYRALNNSSVSDKYPVPHLRSLTMSLHGKKIFSKLDLKRAYLQIPVAPDDVPKTAVCTQFGLFEYLYMPFGLKNAGSTFQRFMDTIFSNVPNIFVYLDDILVASDSIEEHNSDLDKVLSLLSDNNLRLSIEKCEFFQTSLTFLGHEVSTEGIRPPADKVTVISEYPLPEQSSDLRRFMGMLNFFRPMIAHYATIAHPVTELLRYSSSPNKQLTWSDSSKASFSDLKQALVDCPTLSFPSPESTEYQLVTDSSGFAVGAALYQMIDSKPNPIGFFSKKLTDAQKVYSTYDRELLGAYLAVLHFKTYIDGHPVTLFTDHKPIVSAFYSNSTAKSDRQQRQLSFLSEYVSSVQYIRGHNNVVADCLSRPVCATSVDTFDLHGIARLQASDDEIISYSDRLTSFNLTPEVAILCDTSTPTPRPFVPSSSRVAVISSLHNLSHPGCKATCKLVKERYFWPCIDNDVKEFVRNCTNCQQAKIHRHTKSPVEPISAPADRFQTVHIDIVGPLPNATLPHHPYTLPYRYLLTCIDRATRWSEAIPLIDTTASSVAVAFISGWISRFGVPLKVVTDRGAQFESELFSNLSSIIGFHHIRTTSYHPQSNGMIERFHRTLKSAIMARQQNWYVSLPIVMLGLRMTPTSIGFSPFTAVTGSFMLCPHPVISQENISQTTHSTVQTFIKEMLSIDFHSNASGICNSTPTPYIPSDLSNSPKVWMRVDRIRKSLEAPYTGPFQVIKRNPKFFILKLPQGETSVSIDRLKPAYLPSPPPVTPPVNPPPEQLPVPSPPVLTLPPFPELPSLTSSSPEPPPAITTRSGRSVRFKHRPEFRYF